MSEEIAIRVEHVSKNFVLPHEKVSSIKSIFTSAAKKKNGKSETQHALHDISFEVNQGEFFGIVGRNGSGKSTLLKILAGIYQPTEGSVQTHGKLVPFIELGVGFNPELTGRENVYLNGAMLGFSEKEIETMYHDIVDFAELERFMDQKLKNYSSGMQVRLAFSMATRAEADILLIDEVLAVGDADFQRKCFEYFRKLKRDKKTVIFVSHDMNAVREYCDRSLLIDDSNLVKIGSPDEVGKMYTKLFMNEEASQSRSENSKRIGDYAAKFLSVVPNKKSYKADEDEIITIATKLRASRDINTNISIGFMIKNSAGTPILGTNTYELNQKLGTLKKGESVDLNWEIPNVFGDGKYMIDVAVTSTDGTINHDWWEEASGFNVYRADRSPYLITPTIRLSTERS